MGSQQSVLLKSELGLSRNRNFDPERNPEQNSQNFSGIRNSAGNLENKFIPNKRLHMIFLLKVYTVDGFILILKSVLSNS